MRPAWRVAISTASTRRSRTILLAATVALSAAMIAAVSCAMSSLNHAIQENLLSTVGRTDLKISPGAGGSLPRALLDTVRRWPQVAIASGQLRTSMALQNERAWWDTSKEGPAEPGEAQLIFPRISKTYSATAVGLGIVPEDESAIRQLPIIEGRWPTAPGEIAIDEMLAGRLSRPATPGSVFSQVSRVGRGQGLREAIPPRPQTIPDHVRDRPQADSLNRAFDLREGDEVRWLRLLRRPVTFKVVGIIAQPPMGGRSQAYLPLEEMSKLIDEPGKLSQIDIILKPGSDATAIAASVKDQLPVGVRIDTGQKITSGLQQNLAGNELGFVVISAISFLGASFIIMTGLSTGVTERQRELAILRCIGAKRWQLAESQFVIGGLIGVLGAIVGVPLGIGLAALVIRHFEAEVPTGLVVSPMAVLWAGIGAAASGVVGALIPAWMASRTSPLEALAVRSKAPRAAHLRWVTIAAFIFIPIHIASGFVTRQTDIMFLLYLWVGVPAIITGYFLLSVPVVRLVGTWLGPIISRLLGLPADMTSRTVRAAPYRHGFTAGAMSFGLSIMVGLWAQGQAVMRDWIDKLQFPDAFVMGLNLSPEAQHTLDNMPFVRRTCAITLHPVQTEAFGIRGLATYTSTFIAFEPKPFFEMTNLIWVQGDPKIAQQRLEEGSAILVAKEFHTAKGLGVGDMLTCTSGDRSADFEIVGVVHSPGLDIISQYFTIGQDYTEQSLHAIFGSRKDLKEKFGSEAIQLIQIGLVPEDAPGGVDDETAAATIRKELFSAGIYDAGSARHILKDIRGFVERTLMVSSAIAIFALAVASLGVANIIAAGISARHFEFGVLRAIGAGRGLLLRIVLAEVLVIAIGACIIGAISGLQGAFIGQRVQRLVIGLDATLVPPWGAIAAGCGFVIVICILAASPSMISLVQRKPRELLGAVRG